MEVGALAVAVRPWSRRRADRTGHPLLGGQPYRNDLADTHGPLWPVDDGRPVRAGAQPALCRQLSHLGGVRAQLRAAVDAAGGLGDFRAPVQRHRPLRRSGADSAFRRELRDLRARGAALVAQAGAARDGAQHPWSTWLARRRLQRARHADRGGGDDIAAACQAPMARVSRIFTGRMLGARPAGYAALGACPSNSMGRVPRAVAADARRRDAGHAGVHGEANGAPPEPAGRPML